MRSMRMLALAVVASLAGCKQAEPSAKSGSAAPKVADGAGSGSGSSAVAAAPDPGPFLPATLEEAKGIIFTAKAGGAIEVKAKDGTVVKLADGARVDVVESNAPSIDTGEEVDRSAIGIASGGKQLVVLATLVMTEETLRRSPDGKYAVFGAPHACGEICTPQLYVVASDGRRMDLGSGLFDVVAWRPDSKELAISYPVLSLVSLPEWKRTEVSDYTAPAYAPDGTLYVRDQRGSAYTLVAGKAKRVYKAPKRPAGNSEGDAGANEPQPVEFDEGGKPNYTIQ